MDEDIEISSSCKWLTSYATETDSSDLLSLWTLERGEPRRLHAQRLRGQVWADFVELLIPFHYVHPAECSVAAVDTLSTWFPFTSFPFPEHQYPFRGLPSILEAHGFLFQFAVMSEANEKNILDIYRQSRLQPTIQLTCTWFLPTKRPKL